MGATTEQLSAVDAVSRMTSGELTSEDLVNACLARIDAREDTVHAWAHLNAEQALAQARAADAVRAEGGEIEPLNGIPVGLKDIIDTEDFPTEHGSDLFAGRRPAQDATVASLLRRAGAVILGKTVTTEFAMTGARATTNPHDPARTPGGSSSGSAAAVADYMVPLSIGSQTGGSMIRPASYCGVYGYKPTFGSISRAGVMILARRLDHLGVYGRSLDDLVLLGDAVMVHDPADLDMRRHAGCELRAALDEPAGPGAPRLAFVKGPPWDHAEDHLVDVFERYVADLGDAVREVEMAGIFDDALECQRVVMDANLWANLGEYVSEHADQLLGETVERISAGRDIPAVDYIRALELADSLTRGVDKLFDHYDALVTPAATGEAPLGLQSTGSAVFQRIWTLTGAPTVTLPLLKGPNGLPIGVQVVGRRGGDADLMKAARWIDQRGAD